MKRKSILLLSLSLFFFVCAHSQQVMMQGWYWDYPKTAAGKSWADTLRLKAASLKQAGITHIWFPPHTIASFGNNSNGYDPKDLFIGNQTSGLGTRPSLNAMLSEFTAQGIDPVADMIYNHRDGGAAEVNNAVREYITNYYTAAKEPFPSDRFRCIIPLGGASGNGAGDYYLKISSKTGDARFFNYGYKVYMETKTRGWQNLSDLNEAEPNGGGDCGQGNNAIQLGRNMIANVDALGCRTDEFYLNISASDFNAAGDTLYIYLANTGGYSDHRIYGIWSASRSMDIIGDLRYQTYTDFSNMPSGRGQMNFEFFKPNSNNASSTFLNGDWDGMYFFYDYDQFQNRTRDTLINWTKWNWTDLGVRGLRMDAIKHFSPGFVGELLNSMNASGMNPSMVVGEWYGTNTGELSGWVNNVKAAMNPSALAAIQPKIFDFALREQLRQACDNTGYDVRNVYNGSLRDAAGMSGFNIVTFVNNHDFRDANGFASLIKNKPNLAYAYILTNNQLGVPTIFYPDYYGYPAASGGLYGYHPTGLPAYGTELNRLMLALRTYINGSPSVDYLNRFSTPYSSNFISGSSDRAMIYQLQGFAGNGNRDVVVAINFSGSTLRVDHQINNRGGAIAQGTQFTDVLGNSAFPYAVVNSSGQIYMELPPNSYSIWVQGALTVLPARILSFDAKAQEKRVTLNWKISDNEEVASFEIERGENAGSFNKIKTVTASNQTGDAVYSVVDDQPKLNSSMFYRLKMQLKNGSYQYSDLRMIRINGNKIQITLKQTEIGDQLRFFISNESSTLAEVVNNKGQVVVSKNLGANTAEQTINVSSLSTGIYYLRVTNGTEVNTVKFIKR